MHFRHPPVRLNSRSLSLAALGCVLLASTLAGVAADLPDLSALPRVTPAAAASEEPTPAIYVAEYRVIGAKILPAKEVGDAVYPYLGPERSLEDIEAARAALERAYKEKGYQAVQVEVPPQRPKRGIVVLKVVENKVGRLDVKGARWHLPSDIKRDVPSLAPGTVPNFEDVQREIVDLNQMADRRVTPELLPGIEPGTVDVVLTVKDNPPLHGSIELNNRYSPDTAPLRLNGSISYANLWQMGHSIGVSAQVAPERPEDATVYTGYYLARFPRSKWSWMLQGTKQDSEVSTIGGAAVAGRGEIIGLRFLRTLGGKKNFTHSMSFGADYKHFEEDVAIGGETFSTPVHYWPFSATYSAAWMGEKRFTELNTALNFHARGMGAEPAEFDAKRYNATGAYLYFRGDISHTQDLPAGFQLFGKVEGQVSTDPLINSEQFAGGGLATARGYLESAALGDNAIFGTLELRGPNFLSGWKAGQDEDSTEPANEWRVYAFVDGGRLTINDPLPEQHEAYKLASYGVGSFIRLFGHLNGSVDVSVPVHDAGTTLAGDAFVSFRMWAEF